MNAIDFVFGCKGTMIVLYHCPQVIISWEQIVIFAFFFDD